MLMPHYLLSWLSVESLIALKWRFYRWKKYRHYYFHCAVDFLGATWMIVMGMVTTTLWVRVVDNHNGNLVGSMSYPLPVGR